MQLGPGARLHLLGIGGVGMSALAHLAAERGFVVSGSDAKPSTRLARLQAANIDARTPHGPLPAACSLVACSPALPPSHPHVRAARVRGIPVLSRAELLAALLPRPTRVAVAGTHGKTTTTAMVAHILLVAGRDPTVVLGGHAPGLGGGHHLGADPIALFEACEGYGALDHTPAPWVCVTNIDDDHVEQFASFEAIVASFARLCEHASRGLVLGVDDGRLRTWAETLDTGARPLVRFALDAPAEVSGRREAADACQLVIEGHDAGSLRLRTPGAHNLRNALAALATARLLEVEPRVAVEALACFEPVGRRLERVGEFDGIPVLDDYAHHPSEVAAALEAVRSQGPTARIVAVFQPHLPSRERRLRGRFAEALAAADLVVVTPTYAAREAELDRGALPLAELLEARGHPAVVGAQTLEEATARVRALARPGDVVVVLGAGDVGRVAHMLTDTPHRSRLYRYYSQW